MSVVWPASLPTALLIGHSEGPPMNVAPFVPLVGAPGLYQIGDTRSRRVQGRMRISDAQRVTFRTFFESTLYMGTRQFELTSASFDGETWAVQLDGDNPYQLEGAAGGWWLQLSLMLVRRLL